MALRDTLIVSDLHLSEAHVPEQRRPHWMAYKRREFFVDDDFVKALRHAEEQASGPLELVLNGDTFDFDSVTSLPPEPEGHVSWLARLRGLESEEWMSLYKLDRIIADHPDFFAQLSGFIRRGGRVVVVVGNHDVELLWPSAQQRIRDALDVAGHSGERPIGSTEAPDPVQPGNEPLVFCNWFYLSGDTYISHGMQYDPNCVVRSPIDPLIKVRGRPRIRVPFGDLAGRYMLNGMGYFNPNDTGNYIRSAWSYLRFYLRFMLLTQPLLLWTWFWSAMATFVVTLRDHLHSPMRDPLMVDVKVREVARRSGATPSMVRKLHALSVPSACNNPVRIMRELWLDRGLLLLAVLYAAWQIILLINFAWPISPLWVLVPLGLLLPPYLAYAASVRPTVFKQPLLTEERAELIAKITGATRVVFGHTHVPERLQVGQVEYINGGFWSPAFATPECLERIGTQTFVWLRAGSGGERQAQLCEWPPGADRPRPHVPDALDPPSSRAPALDVAS